MFACLHAPALPAASAALLVNCACGFSPRVEETDSQTVLLDIAGLARLLGPPVSIADAILCRLTELGIADAHIAIASNPDAALHAARGRAGITLIPPGEEARVLAGLPLLLLSPPPDLAETLRVWGLRTFGDFAALPEAGLAERLGPEGLRLQQLARGLSDRPLVPSLPPATFAASLELDHPVAQLEPLLFLLARLLEDLLAQLRSQGLAANELRLHLQLDNRFTHARTLRLPFPMASHKIFLKLLQLDLESHPPRAAILAITLEAAAADPRIVQYGLFLPPAPEPEKLELTIGRISRLVGPENLGAPALLDTHRPGAFRLQRFSHAARSSVLTRSQPYLAIRLFRPPLPAQVEAPSGEPRRLAARGIHGEIVSRAGPWRTSGDWWRDPPWSRDEWDIALANGPLCRIYLDHLAGSWFVEGTYD